MERVSGVGGEDGVGTGAGRRGEADDADGRVPVTLSIPAERDYVVLVRSAAGHLGVRAGFSMAEMGDWRLAVDEACGLLLLPDEVDATGEELDCVFRLGPEGLALTVSAEARPGSKPQVGGFGWSLLAALVDDLQWAEEQGRVRVDIVKRAAGEGVPGPDGTARAGVR
ncbi:serine/threonine-protein kinase RsbW [Catenulispora sp. EB89]|uniref:ATP-binding protein n=1 Tax=Catenulispora sp. EB89 TaxID=3156257 RepID=UPI00351183EE